MTDTTAAEPPPQTEPLLRKAEPGSPEQVMCMELLLAAQQTFAPWRQHMLDTEAQPNADMLLATAMATFCGTLVGELVGTTILPEHMVEQVLDSMRQNMANGVDAGRKHIARVAAEQMAEEQREQGGSGQPS